MPNRGADPKIGYLEPIGEEWNHFHEILVAHDPPSLDKRRAKMLINI